MVQSQRIYSWAFETQVVGPISEETIAEAARQFVDAGGAQVWLLDAGQATSFELPALGAISAEVEPLHARGLDRIALVLPEPARPFLAFIQVEPVAIYPFESRDQAVEWIRRGCR